MLIDPSVVPGAKPALFPGFIEPCHPTLREEAPSGERWVHEIKYDGYRVQAHLQNAKLPSTRGGGTTGRSASNRSPMRSLPCQPTT
jgi:bifunctional non-homologous end joining protein LigD